MFYSCGTFKPKPSLSGPPAPVACDQPSSCPTLFGLPAVAARPAKPESQLQNRNILLILELSVFFFLAIELCCSLVLVTKVHAYFVASKCPDLTYCAKVFKPLFRRHLDFHFRVVFGKQIYLAIGRRKA